MSTEESGSDGSRDGSGKVSGAIGGVGISVLIGGVMLAAGFSDINCTLEESNRHFADMVREQRLTREAIESQRRYVVKPKFENRVGDARDDLIFLYSDGQEEVWEAYSTANRDTGFRPFE